ncbi:MULTISPECIES: GNAT family N-acetyltransferase [unclassified Leifsonia]|uniref:GNAT family N-acetyltransferase n=1 Tax=unclassified Leifsonia TaxID=2663824 RepID=UPI000A8FDF0C|nr:MULTISPECIES: GNAT family N-acetyltransferase [unclassified Leifsonia]
MTRTESPRGDEALAGAGSRTENRRLAVIPGRPTPTPTRIARVVPSRRTPGLVGVLERVKMRLAAGRAEPFAALLRRPRFLRGPHIETPVDAAPLRTPRLTLRPYRMSDAPAWFALQSDPAVVRYLPWPIRTRDESRAHLRHRTRHTRLWQTDDILALAIEHEGRLIGDVCLQLRAVNRNARTVEMSWIIDTANGGNGYATEAALAMAQLAFATVNARIITAVIHPDNARSIALAQRLGFRETHRDDHSILMTLSIIDFLDNLAAKPHLRSLLGIASAQRAHEDRWHR